MNTIKIEDLLHRRVLILENKTFGNERAVVELKILEISPSFQWVKVMNANGKKYWTHYSTLKVTEVLEISIKPPKDEN